MSAQPANVIDLNAYRAQRTAGTAVPTTAPSLDQYQPLPFYGVSYFLGLWPAWVMAPIPMIGYYPPGTTE